MRRAVAAITLILALTQGASAQLDVRPEAILEDLRENSVSGEEIRTEEDIRSMNFVSLETFSGAELEDLQEVLDNTEDGFAEVRTAVEANETFETELRARHIDVSTIIAVTKDEDGNATVYYNLPTE